MLEIYNNLTRKKEPFVPIDPNNVRIYVCGMTVYDLCHLGHARVLVVSAEGPWFRRRTDTGVFRGDSKRGLLCLCALLKSRYYSRPYIFTIYFCEGK